MCGTGRCIEGLSNSPSTGLYNEISGEVKRSTSDPYLKPIAMSLIKDNKEYESRREPATRLESVSEFARLTTLQHSNRRYWRRPRNCLIAGNTPTHTCHPVHLVVSFITRKHTNSQSDDCYRFEIRAKPPVTPTRP